MHNNWHRRRNSSAVLAILFFLTAVIVSGTGAASASAHIDASEAASDIRPDDVASTLENASAQALRDRVPATLFPAVTETLQSTGTSDMYEAIPGLSGERAYRLENPPHSMSAKFDTLGVSISSGNDGKWTWSLRFAGYARGRAVGPVEDAHLTADSNRVEYLYPDGVTEWYVNGPLGLQQGFTFESRPSPLVEGLLEVRMTLSGDVTVEVNEGGASALLRSRGGRNTLRYGGLYAYDAAGVELGTRLEATSSGLSILVEDLGAQYPITIDPFIKKDYLSRSEGVCRKKFGISVSVSGDTVVVGTPDVRWRGMGGAVYVFSMLRSEVASATGEVVLTSPRSKWWDLFGHSVAISGDVIVVGAPGDYHQSEPGRPAYQGGIYLFTKPPGGWVSTSDAIELTPPDAPTATLYGMAVSVSGDTVVVGTERISAYVFTKPSNGWTDTSEAAKLTASDGSRDDGFGHSVAVDGDTIIIGAFLADTDDEVTDFGAAYVFTKPSGGWSDTSDAVRLTAPDGAQGREFGRSVSVSGDTLVVGAPYTGEFADREVKREADVAVDKTPYLGSVYVFTRADTGWFHASNPVKLTPFKMDAWTGFGRSLSVSEDTLVVGEPRRSRPRELGGRAYTSGAAYVFTPPPGGWDSASQERVLPMPDIMPYDDYGSSVSASGDFVVVGANGDDNENGSGAGSAYLFRKPTEGWASESSLSAPAMLTAFDGPAGDRFGHSVALAGETLVVGVPGSGYSERGKAYAFVRNNSDWESTAYHLVATDVTLGGRFGSSVAMHEYTIVVGAPGSKDGHGLGAAYVFVRPDGGWGREYSVPYTVRLPMPDDAVDGRFGYSVAVSGDTVVVGAPGKENGGGTGAVYVYTKPDSGWTLAPTPVELTPSDGVAGDQFGHAVSARGDTIVAGAPGSESGMGGGAAYVFTKPDTGWVDTSNSGKLTASDGSEGDRFGHAVSVSGEFIVVGAHGSDIALDGDAAGTQESGDSGAVYAFRRPEGGWTSSSDARKLAANGGGPGETFGYAVSVSGDTMAVGSPNAVILQRRTLEGARSGAVRTFTWPGLLWVDTPEAFKIRPPNAEQSRIFGVSLSADGNTAVVGTTPAEGEEKSPGRSAEAFVYTKRDGVWDTSTPTLLTLPDGGAYVPQTLAVSENGGTIVVGLSAGSSGPPSQSGAALVFARPDEGWVSTSEAVWLTMPSGEPEDMFGHVVSISGDTIVVGASGDNNDIGTNNTGSAYVFTKPAGGWVSTTEAAKFTAPVGEERDRFGSAVSVMDDTIVIGAPSDRDLNGYPAGSAYVFTKPSGGWVSTSESAKLVAPDGWSEDWSRNEFGSSISLMDDTIVVGAPGHAGGSGAAYVFSRPDGGWANPYIVTKLTAPEFDWQIGFGTSVSMSRDTVFVGAPGTRYSDKAGEVFIFPIPTEAGEISGEPARLSDPHGAIGDDFGGVVSVGGNSVAVGALESDDYGLDFGAVYLFSEPTEAPGPKNYTVKLVSPDSDMGGLFGVSVSAIDSAIAVGAPDLLKDSSEGTAYVFARSSGNWLSDVDTVQLTPPDEDESHGFGWSVSLTPDTMAVGAPRFYDDSRQGAAYLYTKPDGGWASSFRSGKTHASAR